MPSRPPGATDRPWPRRLGAIAIALVVTAWFVAPMVNYRHLSSASYMGDVRLTAWVLAWNHRVLSGSGESYWDANVFHPARGTLAFSEHLFGIALPTLPLHLVGAGPVLTHNLAWLASFPLLALSMSVLTRQGGLSRAGALAAGLFSACSMVRIQHVGHLQLLWIFGLPLALACLDRWRQQPRARWLVGCGLSTLMVSLASWYLAVLTGVALIVWAVPCVWARVRERSWRPLGAAGLVAVVVLLVLAGFARPYVGFPPGPVEEMRHNAVDWASYLVPARATWSGQWLMAQGSTAPRWSFGEQTRFLGWTVMVLATTGIGVAAIRSRRARSHISDDQAPPFRPAFWATLGVIGLVALALSFGPAAQAATIVMPFDLVRELPGMSLVRAPARFALLVSLVVAAFAGLAVDVIGTRRRGFLAVALVALGLVELRPVAYELSPPSPETVSPLYDRVAKLPRAPVVSLPVARHGPLPWYDADYQWYGMRHWHPIVNGFSRTEPAGYAARMAALELFPGDAAIEALCEIGTRYVIAHARRPFADFRPALAAAAGHPRLLVLSRDGEDVLWELNCAPQP